MSSPSLISSLLPESVYIDRARSGNIFVSDQYCHAIYKDNLQWLQALDQQPQALLEFLSRRQSRKLGYYFENLVAFWLSQKISSDYFESHVKVSANNRDIGEFDFLFRSNQKFEHWETAVKFYLFTQDDGGLVAWYGPNAKDTLYKKLKRILDHQICLSERAEASSLLSGKGFDDIYASIFMKGYLFYPIGMSLANKRWQVAGCEISPEHLKGWWTSIKMLNEQLLRSISSNELHWRVLPRLEWLAPRVYTADEKAQSLLTGGQIVELLNTQFSQSDESRLIAGYSLNEAGQWQEESRGFVVGENWPA